MVDSITLPSVDALWTEKEFTDNHGKESQSRRGTFRLWRDDTDTHLVVLSMINKIPDGDPHNRCFHFVVQVQKPGAASCAEPALSYYDSNTAQLVPEGRFAMASKTPDEVAGKSKRAAGTATAGTATAGTGTKKHTPAAARARHKGASTHAKKPRSAAMITTPASVVSARGDSGSAFASYVPGATRPKPKSKKSATASGGQARSSRTTRRLGKHTGSTASALSPHCTRRQSQPNDLHPLPQDTTIAFHEDTALLADGCLVVTDAHHMDEGAWGTTCSPPLSVSVHASDETLSAHGGDDADADADAEDEAEMVGLTQMSQHCANAGGNDSMFSPVWSDVSVSRPSSSASATGNASSELSTNSVDSTYTLGASNYTADATPGPVPLTQQLTRGLQHLPPAPPSPPPLLSFGARDVDRLPQPIGFALSMGSSEFAPANSGGKSERDHAADGHDRTHEDELGPIGDGSAAARMLAANTPMAVAIEAGGGDGTGINSSQGRRGSLDMALYNDDSCSSWCDMDDDEQAGGDAEDSPHYSAVLHGTPMAIPLAAALPPSGLLH